MKNVFRQIRQACRGKEFRGGMLVVSGTRAVDRRAVTEQLEELGRECPGGIRIAFVAPDREAYEEMVAGEDAALRFGISARTFFDEENAARWLSGS